MRQMRLDDFLSKYIQEGLSVYEHPLQARDMPMFLEWVWNKIQFRSMCDERRTRHLDHGYSIGWGCHGPGDDWPPTRPHTVERLHCSMQCYSPMVLRPYHWREMSPGCSVAIHVRTGMIILRIFFPLPSELILDRKAYMQEFDEMEKTELTCRVVELLPGEMMQVSFSLSFLVLLCH